eukprot:86538_1
MRHSMFKQCKSIKYNYHKQNLNILVLSRKMMDKSNVFFENDILQHSLDKKEAFLSKKKQTAEISNEWNPQFLGKYTKKMETCKSGDDIMKTLKDIENEIDKIPDTIQYVNAIRKAASLREYNVCFKIFNIAKEYQKI